MLKIVNKDSRTIGSLNPIDGSRNLIDVVRNPIDN